MERFFVKTTKLPNIIGLKKTKVTPPVQKVIHNVSSIDKTAHTADETGKALPKPPNLLQVWQKACCHLSVISLMASRQPSGQKFLPL